MLEGNFNYQDFVKICKMVHSITKIDIRLHNQDGDTLFQRINHYIPAVLHQPGNEATKMNEILHSLQANHYYHHINTFGLEYLAIGIWRGPSFYGSILAGPFISHLSVIELLRDIISKNNLPIGERKQLEQFYQSLPTFSETEYKNIGEMLVNLCGHDFIYSGAFSSGTPLPPLKPALQKTTIEGSKHLIEYRYEHQNKLMDAITKGDKAEVHHLIHSMTDFVAFSDRVPGSPIRSSKNISFVFNTLCRVAAEKSGVHPVYLDNISERFAILIERATTLSQLKKLFVVMANEYCDLVDTFATGHYSLMVKNALDYILLNLGGPLTLQLIADEIHVNPSHLSRKFKSDTGMTVTEFINRKRVEEAKLYLQRGNSSITDVAFMVGFNDLNYFTKVFKKITSMTPSHYVKRKSINLKNNS